MTQEEILRDRRCPVCRKVGVPNSMATLFGVRARWHLKCFKLAQDAGTFDARPTPAQMAALERWKLAHGRTWRADLSAAWLIAGEGVSGYEPALQQLRNNFGPSWLYSKKVKT